jgi:hypothetical protein
MKRQKRKYDMAFRTVDFTNDTPEFPIGETVMNETITSGGTMTLLG